MTIETAEYMAVPQQIQSNQTQLSASPPAPLPQLAALDRLMELTPPQTDRNLEATLKTKLGLSFVQERVSVGRTQGGLVPMADGRPASENLRSAAIKALEQAMQPAPIEVLAKNLAALSLATKSKSEHDDDREARIQIYISALRTYPADCALTAIRGWLTRRDESAKFFPALSELIADADRLAARRRAMANSVWCSSRDPAKGHQAPPGRSLTPDELVAQGLISEEKAEILRNVHKAIEKKRMAR